MRHLLFAICAVFALTACGNTGDKQTDNKSNNKQIELTHTLTPSGGCAYKEAEVIIDCSLLETTTLKPSDFYDDKAQTVIENGSEEAHGYHNLVFGTVTNM